MYKNLRSFLKEQSYIEKWFEILDEQMTLKIIASTSLKQSCSVSKKTQQLPEGRFGLTKYVPQQPSTIITAKAKADIAHLRSIPVFVAVVNVRSYVSLLTEQLCLQECSFPWDNNPLWHTWTLSGLFHTYKLYQEENTPFQIARLYF